jgi:ribonuclease HI
MKQKQKKYYVVWNGHKTGIFDTWEACRKAVEGFEGARYKSFPDEALAKKAFVDGPGAYWGKPAVQAAPDPARQQAAGLPTGNSIAVDAACNSTNGQMEYQGVYVMEYQGAVPEVSQPLFHQGPYQGGSNNIGEFLAIVHALAWCKKHRVTLPIYTDSATAMAWVRKKKANTKVVVTAKNKELFDLIQRAESWLNNNTWDNRIIKWNTAVWGEIPADFGRK